MTKVIQWHGCYDGNLKDLIVPEAFKHPAKMSRKLCERIFDYGCEQGYWQPGDTIIDPFGGIGTTGIIGAYRGYKVISIELEDEFYTLALQNREKNQQKIELLGHPTPTFLNGDSRKLLEILGQANGCVTSPPFLQSSGGAYNPKEREDPGLIARHAAGNKSSKAYGSEVGQIHNLPEGDHDQVVGAISSPPYENSIVGQAPGTGKKTTDRRAERLEAAGYNAEKILTPGRRAHGNLGEIEHYSDNQNNLGNQSGDTYWSAVALIYQQVFQLLPPGGAFAVVIKDFVRNKKRVPLCDQTAELLETIGFDIPERIHAMLIKEIPQTEDMFTGKSDPIRKEHKSFFRRLAEKKGAPPIDWEEVIWAIKP